MYYVYALIDVRTNLPFYIGKGLKKNNRHLDHLKETIEHTSNKHKLFKINYLISNGYAIETKILVDNIENEKEAYDIETTYIKKYGRKNIDPNGILTNICLHNRPPSHKGRKKSPEHVAKVVASMKKTWATKGRKKPNPATNHKHARYGKENGFYGKTHSAKVRQEHSERMKGNKNNKKTFIFTNPEGIQYIVIGDFNNFCHNMGLPISTMEKVLKTQKNTSYGKAAGWSVIKDIQE